MPIAPQDAAELDLRAELTRRFTTETETVTVSGVAFELLRPRNADDLISEADYVMDERLPYWADLWPSARALAGHFLDGGAAAGRLIELGCGLGLVTSAALNVGYDVLATDYYADALSFTRLNALHATGRAPATRHLDWSALPPADELGSFDRVVAADVLYEHRYSALVANAIVHTLAPGGAALIADPGRIGTPRFLELCEAAGLHVARTEQRAIDSATARHNVTIYTLAWKDGVLRPMSPLEDAAHPGRR
jgi:ETFB lysine methyltransferase